MLGSRVDLPPHRQWLLGRRAAMVGGLGAVAFVVLALLAIPTIRQELPGFRPDELATAGGHRISGAFLYQQQRSLSCEYASAHIAATMVGYEISEYDIEAVVPLHENPHKGYRGNILGTWGNTTDYGVYSGPLSAGLTQLGVPNHAFYGTRDELEAELQSGRPVIVWLGMRGEGFSQDAWDNVGDRYQLTTYMHVMTAYGFDERGVYLTDPGKAVWQFYSWSDFMAMWNVMDGMGLSVHT